MQFLRWMTVSCPPPRLLTVAGLLLHLSCCNSLVQTDPRHEADVISYHTVVNHLQCQRLCWYLKLCVRSSFHNIKDSPPGNCFLHNSAGSGGFLKDGWTQTPASQGSLTPTHTCAQRPCGETKLCVPVKGKDTHSYRCINIPGDEDACASSPCQNGGTCVDSVNRYYCNCVAGYNGQNCQTDIDECISSPCQNSGQCVDKVNSYACQCAPGFTGQQCQTRRQWLEKTCSADNDCTESGAGCFSQRCLCAGGLFYSQKLNACVTGCTEGFHNSYQVYRKWDFNFKTAYTHDNREPTWCQRKCSEDSKCLTFVHNGNCYFKYSTAQQHPQNWFPANGIDTYQKQCV